MEVILMVKLSGESDTILLDLDDTFVKTEDLLRRMLKAEGLTVPTDESVYMLRWRNKDVYSEIMEEIFSNYENLDEKDYTDGALEALNLLKTEYNVIFCSCYLNEAERVSKKRLADNLETPIILVDSSDFSKSSVDSKGKIIIDDSIEVLQNSKAKLKLQMFNRYNTCGLTYREYLVGDHLIKNLSEAVDYLIGGDIDDKCKNFRGTLYPRI